MRDLVDGGEGVLRGTSQAERFYRVVFQDIDLDPGYCKSFVCAIPFLFLYLGLIESRRDSVRLA